MTPIDDHKNIQPPLAGDDDVYGVSVPVESNVQHELAAEYMRKAAQKRITVADEPPPRPAMPMISGVFTFPFYLPTLGPWMFITMGLLATCYSLIFMLVYGLVLGITGVWIFGLMTCAFGLLTGSYASACCLIVIEETFNGWDKIENWPDFDWKEWIWSFLHIVVLVLQAGLVGLVPQLILGADSPWPLVIGGLVAFPFVLLGALAGDGAWFPMAIGRVLRSLIPLGWAWGVFYLITAPMIAGWIVVTRAGIELAPVATPLYSCPLLVLLILIYARLVGRLAMLIGEVENDS